MTTFAAARQDTTLDQAASKGSLFRGVTAPAIAIPMLPAAVGVAGPAEGVAALWDAAGAAIATHAGTPALVATEMAAGETGAAGLTAGVGLGAGSRLVSNVDAVISETLNSVGNIVSKIKVTAGELLDAGEQFLGTGYKEIGKSGSGVFRSADELRQFRIDKNSLLGNHKPDVPHGHLEVFKQPGDKEPATNNHIPFIEEK